MSLKDDLRILWEDMPDSVRAEIEDAGLAFDSSGPPYDGAHIFVTERAALDQSVRRLLPLLAPTGFLWVSWPKKVSGVPTDITEDVIRAVALPLGLVDVKVCAVDDIWSGLKLMIRRENR